MTDSMFLESEATLHINVGSGRRRATAHRIIIMVAGIEMVGVLVVVVTKTHLTLMV